MSARSIKIQTIEELAAAVTPDNAERLAKDLVLWVHSMAEFRRKGLIPVVGFLEWVDDGNHEIIIKHVDEMGESQ